MRSIFKKTSFALMSLFIFMLGNGLFNTLIPLRMKFEQVPTFLIGLIGSTYYAGLVVGSFRMEPFIVRVGHIRAFSVFASMLAAICVLHGLFFNVWLWVGLRFLGGFATAGLFIVIESWLLLLGTKNSRGRILSLYMVVLYAGQALGQFLINLDNQTNLTLYAFAGMLGSLSVIPIAMSKIPAPKIEKVSKLDFKLLWKKATTGLVGSFCSGLILGSVYGLFPVYLLSKFSSASSVAFFMATIILGGMALQYPVGKISDFFDRRLVLIIINLSVIVCSTILSFMVAVPYIGVLIVFVLGGLTFTIYPLSITYGCESLESEDIVAGSQGLLLAYSIGASAGPLLAPIFIYFLGKEGLPIFFAVISAILATFIVWRKMVRQSQPQEESFISVTQTTPVITELDPRTD